MAHFQRTMQTIQAQEASAAFAAGVGTDVANATMAVGDVSGEIQPAEPVWRDGDPDVSDWVIYQPRRGMIRRGRNRVAALVVHRHPHARLLDLAIFYEANDTLDDQRVPEAVGDERGWLQKRAAAPLNYDAAAEGFIHGEQIKSLRQEIADLRVLMLGGYNIPEKSSVCELLSMVDERVDKLERAVPKPKRKYERKAKPAKAE